MSDAAANDLFMRRVCLRLEGMDAVDRDVPYAFGDDRLMDVYYPPQADTNANARPPVVVIVAGYAGPYKKIGWAISMAQLIAASGMAAIAYTNREPLADLRALMERIRQDATTLRLDASRIGIVAASGSAPTALATVMRGWNLPPRCAAFSYGCLLDLDGATDVLDASRQAGFTNACAGYSVHDLRRDLPLFIVRAGRDGFPAMNASIDRFVTHGLAENLPISLVNHAEAPHAFDLVDDTRASRDVVRQVLGFLKRHLEETDR